MASQMNWIDAKVEIGGAFEADMHVTVQANVARKARMGQDGYDTKTGVVAVRLSAPSTATVEFQDGEVWTVTRDPNRKPKGCGCG